MESSPAVRSGGFQGTSLFGSVDHTAHLWHRRMRTPTYIDLGWIMLNTFMVSYGFILERSWRVNIMWTSCFRNIFLWCRMVWWAHLAHHGPSDAPVSASSMWLWVRLPSFWPWLIQNAFVHSDSTYSSLEATAYYIDLLVRKWVTFHSKISYNPVTVSNPVMMSGTSPVISLDSAIPVNALPHMHFWTLLRPSQSNDLASLLA